MVRCFAAIAALVLLSSSAWAEWSTFADSRGSSVQYPREVFSVPAGSGEPPGPVLQSADGRARLHVFTRPNERRASPSEFIHRAVTDQGERLSYKRVTDRFLVFSAAQGDLTFTGAAISWLPAFIASTYVIREPKSVLGMGR